MYDEDLYERLTEDALYTAARICSKRAQDLTVADAMRYVTEEAIDFDSLPWGKKAGPPCDMEDDGEGEFEECPDIAASPFKGVDEHDAGIECAHGAGIAVPKGAGA